MTFGAELAGLPAGGPATLPAAKLQLNIVSEDTGDDETLTAIVAAVNAQVRSWRCASLAVDAADWSGAGQVVLGANMLVARLFRRRNSPGGVEAFGSDGAVYVSRSDPDVAQLLWLGVHQPPTVG